MSAGREQDYISRVRDFNRQIWEGVHGLKALQAEWNALDYGNTLDAGAGSNDGIVKADIGSVTFDTCDALLVVLGAGHATNMAKLL